MPGHNAGTPKKIKFGPRKGGGYKKGQETWPEFARELLRSLPRNLVVGTRGMGFNSHSIVFSRTAFAGAPRRFGPYLELGFDFSFGVCFAPALGCLSRALPTSGVR